MSSWFRVQIPRLIQFPVTWVASVEVVWWVVQILLTFEEIESHGHAQMQASSISVWGTFFFSANSHFRVISLAFSQPPTHPPVWKAFIPQHGLGGVGWGCCLKAHPSFSKPYFFSIFRNGTQEWFLRGRLDPPEVTVKPPNLQSFRISHLT